MYTPVCKKLIYIYIYIYIYMSELFNKCKTVLLDLFAIHLDFNIIHLFYTFYTGFQST